MPMAVKSNLFLYSDAACLFVQNKNIKNIEKQLNENFANIWDYFVDNKLSIYFGEESPFFLLLNVRSKSFRS